MGSLNGLFDMSRSALMADQAALNATANNVANQNTVGYTKQVASFTAGDMVTLTGGGNSTVQLSSGPQATTTAVRDRVLEQRIQQKTQAQSSSSAESDVLTQIQNVFSVSGSTASTGSTQIGTALNTFFSSLTTLSGNPMSTATQQGVLKAASVLASTLNSAATQLQTVGSSVNSAVNSSVTAVNALTTTIAGLNKQISEVSPQGDAGVLEDQRQLAIAQLSQYVGLDQIRTENNGITLTTQGGAVLVEGGTASALKMTTVNGNAAILDSSGTNITAGVQGGSIGGQIAGQTVDLPAATTALDALAYQVATAVNAQNQAGLTTAGVAGGAIFSVPATAAGCAATISVIPTNPNAVATAAVGEGSSGNGNAAALANVATTVDSSGQTVAGRLGAMLGRIGSSASSLQQQTTTQQATLTQLTTQRSSLSSVSLDTEAANLSQYEKSYQAAAQLLTVLDRLMATAMNIGVQTTVT